jgi:hypothetical protein
MTNCHVHFDPDIPADIRAIVEAYVDRWSWLLPRWLQRLNVLVRDQGEVNEVANCHSLRHYRWATVTLYSCWLTDNEERREQSFVHELLHIPTAALAQFSRDAIKLLAKDEALQATLLAQLDERNEAATSDFADVIYQRYKEQQQ